MGNRKWMMA